MGRASIKSNDPPIPLPHDGLLYPQLKQGEAQDCDNDIVQTALELLHQKREDRSEDSLRIAETVSLVKTLRDAKSVKEQLQTLQTFRSKSLQQRKQSESDEVKLSEREYLYRFALFRILLEWFLSIQTPVPVRRAIQANLEGILKEVENQSSLPSKVIDPILDSIIDPRSSVWQQPLHSLHEALNYKVTHDILLNIGGQQQQDGHSVQRILQFLRKHATNEIQPILIDTHQLGSSASDEKATPRDASVFFVEENVTVALQRSIQWAGILKTVLAEAPSMAIIPILSKNTAKTPVVDDNLLVFFETFLLQIMTCRITPVDSLSILGVVCSRVLLLRHPPRLLLQNNDSSDQPQQGSIATHISNLTQQKNLTDVTTIAMVQGLAATAPIPIMLQESKCLLTFFQQQSNEADPGVRLAALKGIHTLISRCLSRTQQQEALLASELQIMQSTTQGTLEIVLLAWENPPNRRLGNAIPSLFQKLVALMQALGTDNNNDTFQELVMRLLAQPSNRKGRYRALEALLPLVGSRQMISLGGWQLIESLLEGIGDRNSHSARTLAGLWEKILSDLLQDMLEDEKSKTGADANGSSSSKKKQKRQFAPELVEQVLPKWWDIWVHSLAAALLSNTASRRRHVAGFCLPRITSMVGGRKKRQEASRTFACLLDSIHVRATEASSSGICDRELWTTLEVARHAHLEKLVDLSPECAELVDAIKSLISINKLRAALKHFSSNIRLVAFQSIQPIVVTTSASRPNEGLGTIEQEIALWKEAFPYAIKTDGKEYKASLLKCLTAFIDRVSNVESTQQTSAMNEANLNVPAAGLPILHSFVVEFLTFDVVLRQAAYPASICEKEAFAIELLECILAFASRDSRFVSKDVAVYERKRRPREAEAGRQMLEAMLSREGLSSLFSLLHSMWDGNRLSSFRLLLRLVLVAQANGLDLAVEYTAASMRAGMMARGVYLASSPRQRESDTGARILAFLNFSLVHDSERWSNIRSLVDLLETRLTSMKDLLSSLLSGEIDPLSSDGGTRLPLAHGLIHSLQLLVEAMGQASQNSNVEDAITKQKLCERMASIFCMAIQVSLAVVADVKDGAVLDGMDDDLITSSGSAGAKDEVSATPLNVNTGAIGANGTFSSTNPTEEDEHQRRIAIQRIVMGSWLLTRETCAALATLLTSQIFAKSHSLLDKAGSLLISTLVSLKHAGAAFAAHRALQQVSEFCFRSNDPLVGKLPASWANRLLEEISAGERVRDSTLRRSTGFALGFLAIMRSEMASKVEPRSLCPFILKQILHLSLPKVADIGDYFDKLKLSEPYRKSAILQLTREDNSSQFEIRSRVHALNILRLIIMDAPLANAAASFVGAAIVSAVIGYSDDSWTVRNSSTMVYAAVMLRSIDADKNANVNDITGNNATTIGELFKTYPLLPDFLTAVLNQGVEEIIPSSKRMAMSPIFPILLLLARVQSVSNSGAESKEMAEPFIPAVFKCLQNRHLLIRTAASRALANLCLGPNGQSISSLVSMLNGCHNLLNGALKGGDWNSVHGALMGIRELASKFQETGNLLRQSGLLQYFTAKLSGVLLSRWPPACASMVVQILDTVSPPSDISTDWHQQIEEAWNSTTPHLAELPQRVAGSSDFATAAQVLCKQLVTQVWDLRITGEEHEEAMSKLSMLLNSEMIDVRLYVCKAIKKSLYDNIDKIVASDSLICDDRVARVISISSTLLRALRLELDRCGGSHPPTLRRLSRCVLECIEACNKMMQETGQSDLFPEDLKLEIAFAAGGLIKQDSWHHDNNLTTMSGNGIEIMSFVISWHLRQSTSVSSDGDLDKICGFVDSLNELNNPTLPWRLRYSAAVAIEQSQLLERGAMNETLKQAQHQVLEEALSMLQDPDPDVRCAAGRASQGKQGKSQEQSTGTGFPFPSVSQFVLEEAHQCAYSPTKNELGAEEMDRYAVSLLEGIIKRCQGMKGKLNMLRREFQHTESSFDLDKLLNVGTERKIFEDEVVNAYEEPALANQLAVHVLLHLKPVAERTRCLAATQNLTNLCEHVLSTIKLSIVNSHSGDLLHEVSRSNLVFVEFHSILVASVACAVNGWTSNERAKRIQELAAEITSIVSASQKLHPMIGKSLKVLAEAQVGLGATKTDVLRCLFLLPPRMIE